MTDTSIDLGQAPHAAASATGLPENHPQRFILNNEVHARPPEPLEPPCRLSYLALFSGGLSPAEQRQPLQALAAIFGGHVPADEGIHFSVDLGPFRLRWERHTEFVRYTFIVPGAPGDPFEKPAIAAVPADWLQALPGRVLVAAHGVLVPRGTFDLDPERISKRFFNGRPLVGAAIAGGGGTALTDFHIHADGCSRFLAEVDDQMSAWQAGRLMQRLFEIDTYRILAMLALPVARELSPFLSRAEGELAGIMGAMASEGEEDEPAMLDRLTRLEAAIESHYADTHYRFSAAAAYYGLVQRRIDELRENRIEGLQTFHEFVERRLAPAMNTCQATAGRQGSLSERVARAVQLLSTRVDVARAQQNQEVLQSMNRRAAMQLRLQETVEGLSIAAVTYYIVGLVGYAAGGLEAAGLPVDGKIVMAVSIPIVAVLVALSVRKVRKIVPGFKKEPGVSQ